MSRINIPDDIPNGHEKSYRSDKGDAMKIDRRSSSIKSKRPENLPEGHSRSYDRGFEDGLKEFNK